MPSLLPSSLSAFHPKRTPLQQRRLPLFRGQAYPEPHDLEGSYHRQLEAFVQSWNAKNPKEVLPRKVQRLIKIIQFLRDAPAASDFPQAFVLLCTAINTVENKYHGGPFLPEDWDNPAGRVYPILPGLGGETWQNVWKMDPSFPGVVIMESKGQYTSIAPNGAIFIRQKPVLNSNCPPQTLLDKPGLDDRTVMEFRKRLYQEV